MAVLEVGPDSPFSHGRSAKSTVSSSTPSATWGGGETIQACDLVMVIPDLGLMDRQPCSIIIDEDRTIHFQCVADELNDEPDYEQ